MRLDPQDRGDRVWKLIKEHLQKREQTLLTELRADLPQVKTDKVRGQLDEIENLLKIDTDR